VSAISSLEKAGWPVVSSASTGKITAAIAHSIAGECIRQIRLQQFVGG
jgi:hypothetical protein